MKSALRASTLILLFAGIGAWLAGRPDLAPLFWIAGTLTALVPLAVTVSMSLARREPGVDLIALLAMIGALWAGEFLAGSIVAAMLAIGTGLEDYAARRARSDLASLRERIPRVVHRHENGTLAETSLDDVAVGDRLLVRAGEVVPVDGRLVSQMAILDESALTGEPLPVTRHERADIRGGVVNAGPAFDLEATARAGEGTYAAIVKLVHEAEAGAAPTVRLADRWAGVFTLFTLALAGGTWALTRDPLRALAVLVVATPCPLILAAPIAIVSGLSRCARAGVVVKGGGVLESLGRALTLVMDKTGTLTVGSPRVHEVVTLPETGADTVLRLAGSVELGSLHPVARSVIAAANERGITLTPPADVRETPGIGVLGRVDGRTVRVGKPDWILGGRGDDDAATTLHRSLERRAQREGASISWVEIDGMPAGAFLVTDPVREDAPRTIRALRRAGIERIVMASGDRREPAETIGMRVGVDAVHAELTPPDKLGVIERERQMLSGRDGTVVMVGDGINDAPALAAADVGVALGAGGASAASEAADVVLLVDRIDRLAIAVRASRRARRIALESILLGMGLSVAAMFFAAAGRLPPVAGALLQEGIDILAIANALRALGGRARSRIRLPAAEIREMHEDHARLRPRIEHLREVADRLDEIKGPEALRELEAIRAFLVEELVPHEREDEQRIYPMISRAIGGTDPTAPMSRTHHEIAHQANVLGRFVSGLPESGPDAADRRDLRRMLYSLHAILTLHFAQEDEHYLPLLGDPRDDARAAVRRA